MARTSSCWGTGASRGGPWILSEMGSRSPAVSPSADSIQIQVNHRRGVKGYELRQQQSANNSNAHRAPEFRTLAVLERKGQGTQQSGHGGHHNRPEPKQTRLVNRFFGRRFL